MAWFLLKNEKNKTKNLAKFFCGPQYFSSVKFGPRAKKSGHPWTIVLRFEVYVVLTGFNVGQMKWVKNCAGNGEGKWKTSAAILKGLFF